MRGATPIRRWRCARSRYFNPRTPCGVRPTPRLRPRRGSTFQSTRPMRGATDDGAFLRAQNGISIHAPHAGRDIDAFKKLAGVQEFQSTRPMRGATFHFYVYALVVQISIHAPHAGRDARSPFSSTQQPISIHAPLAGRDMISGSMREMITYFNPRAPCGARLAVIVHLQSIGGISIHAPRAGRD